MAIIPSLTQSYAKAIYKDGTKTFPDIKAEYVDPVKQYAADKYYIEDIENAALQGWITSVECVETLTLKGPEDPQYRPDSFKLGVSEA